MGKKWACYLFSTWFLIIPIHVWRLNIVWELRISHWRSSWVENPHSWKRNIMTLLEILSILEFLEVSIHLSLIQLMNRYSLPLSAPLWLTFFWFRHYDPWKYWRAHQETLEGGQWDPGLELHLSPWA